MQNTKSSAFGIWFKEENLDVKLGTIQNLFGNLEFNFTKHNLKLC